VTPKRRGGGIHTRSSERTVGDRVLWGLGFSILLHLLLVSLAITLMPLWGRFSPVPPPPAPRVLTLRLRDQTADVDASSRVQTAPKAALQGAFASRSRDRSPSRGDSPVPSGLETAFENSLPSGATSSGSRSAPTAPPDEASGTQPAPDGAGRAIAEDGVRSETAMLTGRRDEPVRDHGTAPSPRTMEQTGKGALEFGDFAFSIIQGGWTLVRAVLDRQGHLLDCRIIGEQGHPSLHPASFGAMEGAAPFRPLPQSFPDDSLVVTVRFIYMRPGEKLNEAQP
jgi:hypothetical protein